MGNYPLKHWIPYKLNFEGSEIICEWLYVGEMPFSKPFFESSISECKNYSQNRHKYKPVSSFQYLSEIAVSSSSLTPSAFIFHVSRSGSTLLTQLLSVDSQNIVISEAPIFDEILRVINFSKFEISNEEIIKTFTAAVSFLGQKRKGNEQNYFIKLDSWHLMYYEIIRKAFPETPFIFSYRKPTEVINSHGIQPGIQAVPGMLQSEIFGINLNKKLLANHELYLVKLLEKYFEKLIEIKNIDSNTVFLNYEDGIFKNMDKMQGFMDLEISDAVKIGMEHRAQYHSKNVFNTFIEPETMKSVPDFQENLDRLYQKLALLNNM